MADTSLDVPSKSRLTFLEDDGSPAGSSPGHSPFDSILPVAGSELDLSVVAAAAENAGASTPSVFLTCPSDERNPHESPALLTPERPARLCAQKLRSLKAQLPAIWSDLFLTISQNPALEQIALYADGVDGILHTTMYMMEVKKHTRDTLE